MGFYAEMCIIVQSGCAQKWLAGKYVPYSGQPRLFEAVVHFWPIEMEKLTFASAVPHLPTFRLQCSLSGSTEVQIACLIPAIGTRSPNVSYVAANSTKAAPGIDQDQPVRCRAKKWTVVGALCPA